MIVVRYADDLVVGFQYLADAHRFLAELKQRLEALAGAQFGEPAALPDLAWANGLQEGLS